MARRRDLFTPPRRRRWGSIVLPAFFLLILVAGIFLNSAMSSYPKREAKKVTVLGLPRGLEGLRILHMSDLHAKEYGVKQDKLMPLVRHDNYRAVCMTGDMVGQSGNVQPLLDALANIPSDVPTFFIAGDEDPPPIVETVQDTDSPYSPWVQAAQEAGAIYLDSPYKVEMGKDVLWFCPASLLTVDLPAAQFAMAEREKEILLMPEGEEQSALLRAVKYRQHVLERTLEAKREMLPQHTYIALSHAPLGEESVSLIHHSQEGRVVMNNFPGTLSLILSGHLNNGQVRLPGLKALYAPPSEVWGGGFFPDDRVIAGVSSARGVVQHVSPGLGVSRVYPWWASFRFFNPPVISVLTLTADIY